MRKLIVTIIILCVAVNAFAGDKKPARERETLKEKFVGMFVKTFAKSYVATHNLEKFKEKNIKKILKMDEAKFQRVYTRIYKEMIKDLPQHLKDMYGVEEKMTRQKAIARINAFKTKKEIYKMINAVPNKMIARHFVKHKDEFKKTMNDNKGVDGMVDQLLADPAST